MATKVHTELHSYLWVNSVIYKNGSTHWWNLQSVWTRENSVLVALKENATLKHTGYVFFLLKHKTSQRHLFNLLLMLWSQGSWTLQRYLPSSIYRSSQTPVIGLCRPDWQGREILSLPPSKHSQFCYLATDGCGTELAISWRYGECFSIVPPEHHSCEKS